MIYRISCEKFIENAVYHLACITEYTKNKKEPKPKSFVDTDKSEHDQAFILFIDSIKDDLLVHKKVFLCPLY